LNESPEATVFIVDDDEAVRQSLKWLVESVGLNAEVFSNSGLEVKLSGDAPAGSTVLSAVGALPSA
jgi:FixJ family two-component response regulator